MHRTVLTWIVLGAATWCGTAAQAAHFNGSAPMDGSDIVLNRHSDARWSNRSSEPVQLAEHCRDGYRYPGHGYYGARHGGYPGYRQRRVYSAYPHGYPGYYGDDYHHHHHRRHYYYEDPYHSGIGIQGSHASFWISF